MTELFDLHDSLLNTEGVLQFSLRLLINTIFASIVTFGVYMQRYGKNEYIFTYIMFNVITFTLCFSLRQVPIELGFALGLFAVFGILRYRTQAIRIHDLTYLFIVIGLGIFNAVANNHVSLSELLLVNIVITSLTAFLEKSLKLQHISSMQLLYDDLNCLHQDTEELLATLSQKTGKSVYRVAIHQVDFLKETVELTIWYHDSTETKR